MKAIKDEFKSLPHELENFTGSEVFFSHTLFTKFKYTEGIQYLAQRAGAYWLIDLICGTLSKDIFTDEGFIVANLKVIDSKAVLTFGDGDGRLLYVETIDCTDFPLSHVKIYIVNNTILLPKEY